MPVKFSSNDDIPRIKFGPDTTIRRAYLGDQLVYGLYDVHYYDRENIDTYSPKQYAWGYKPEAVEFPLPNDAPEYFNEYLTHYGESTGSYGWYDENTLTNRKDKIDIDDHRDLHMYARWRQHRYSFEGTIAYDVYRYVPPSSGAPNPDDNPTYPWDGAGANAMPNCTWYAYYRVQEMGYPAPFSYWRDAGQWWLDNAGNGWVAKYDDNWQPGDIVVWNGHVAVVEGDGEISESVLTYGGPGYTLERDSSARELYKDVKAHWNEPAYSIGGGDGGILSDRYWSKQSGSRWFSGAGIGRLHYEG